MNTMNLQSNMKIIENNTNLFRHIKIIGAPNLKKLWVPKNIGTWSSLISV